MEKIIKPIKNFTCDTVIPGDKSITHRAILFSALLGSGKNKIYNALLGGDCLSTINCVTKLGAKVEIDKSTVTVKSAAKITDEANLYVGNSGTTMRLLCGILAGQNNKSFTLTGDNSIQSRPMKRVSEPLSLMGADITGAEGMKAPLRIVGKALKGIDYISPVSSAQVKSAVLLAGLSATGATSVTEPVKSRDHTERMLKYFGADIEVDGLRVTAMPSRLKLKDVYTAGDISSAAYPLIAAAAKPGGYAVLRGVGINPTRDGVLRVLEAIGAKFRLFNQKDLSGEPTADIEIEYAPLKPFNIDGDLVPLLIDELPVLAVLGCFIDGESTVSGAGELRVKESDRIKTTVSALKALGADIEEREDGFIIRGTGGLKGGGAIDAYGDHRIAMSMAVASALSESGGLIKGAECAFISYPGFYNLF